MATPQRARSRRLTREEIVATALELADREGLETLSIRTIAQVLDVSPMALYRHVSTKDEIVDLVVAEMLTRRAERTHWPRHWDEIVRLTSRELRSILRHHPVVRDTMQRRAVAGPHAFDAMEHLLAALAKEGVDDRGATRAYGNLVAFVFGHVALQEGRESALAANGETPTSASARLTEQITALSEQGYPHVAAVADEVPRLFDDAQFDRGVELIIMALRAEHSLS